MSNIKEIQIPVPWGIIAAKTWGNEKNPLILAIHGWCDNANSFDTLIPLLTDAFYYVCIDLPSHGKSTLLNVSLFLHTVDYLIVLKLIYDYLKRDKIIILAHSLGAFLSLHFTQYYPQYVEKIICLDALYYHPKGNTKYFNDFKHLVNGNIKFLQKQNSIQPTYTKEEAVHRLVSGRMTKMSKRSMRIIAERNLEPAEDGKFKMRIPQHIKFLVFIYMKKEDILELVTKYPIKCPHLLIMSTNSYHCLLALNKVHKQFKKNPHYELHVVEGNHEVHLEHPERIATFINKFLLKSISKL